MFAGIMLYMIIHLGDDIDRCADSRSTDHTKTRVDWWI
jgi:hypothetical protein